MSIFEGIYPALVTPANPDNTINTEMLCQLLDYLVEKGVDGFYVGGTTGEGIFMPLAQRKLLTETVLSYLDGRVPVIVHVGSVSIDDAITLAQHAEAQGAVAVSSILPPLYKNLDAITRYYLTLADAVHELPFLPYILNPEFDAVALIKRLLAMPNLSGTKYTGPNMFEFRQILSLGEGHWAMFSGMDEQCVYAAMMGATGAIGSTLNFMPGVYREIRALVQAGNIQDAQALQLRANQVTQVMIDAGFQGALKAVLSRILGQDVGHPRLPNLSLTGEEIEQLHARLAENDFDTLIAM